MATPGLGDIANIVKLGVKVATLLHEAAKIAPKEIRDIIQQVDYLHAVLRSTKTALEDHGAILRQHPDIKRAIAKVFRNCEETLNELHEVAKEYERAIQRDGVPRDEATVKERWAKAFKTGYLRAKFLTMDEALAGINENLRGHMAALNLMMQNLHSRNVSQLRMLMTPLSSDILRIYDLVQIQNNKIELLIQVASGAMLQHSPAVDRLALPEPATPRQHNILHHQHQNDIRLITAEHSQPRAGPSPAPVDFNFILFDSDSDSDTVSPTTDRLEGFRLPTPAPMFEFEELDFEETTLDLSLFGERRGSTASSLRINPFKCYASSQEHTEFLERVKLRRYCDVIPIKAVHFVYRARSGNSKHLASNTGDLHLLRSSEDLTEAASSVWITNSDRTVRIQHKVPVWEQIIPYTLHGKQCSVIINQGTGLLFYAPDPSLEHGTQVPTAWVEYTFKTVDDCHRFQERLAGQKMLLAADVAHISRNKTLGSGESLCGREQIRIWKDPHSGVVSVMVRLAVNKGWRKYLVFELSKYSVVVNQKGSDKLRIRGIQARIDDEGYGGGDGYSSGTSVRSSGSSVYTSASSDSGSGKKKPKIADDITIAFSSKDDCTRFYKLYVNSRH